jgi:hypothetical protein
MTKAPGWVCSARNIAAFSVWVTIFVSRVCEIVEQCEQLRANSLYLGSMGQRELGQKVFPFFGNVKKDRATILAAGVASHEILSHEPIREFYRCVMGDLKLFR